MLSFYMWTGSNNIFPLYKLNKIILQINDKKSNFFYKNIITQKIEIPFEENYWKKIIESENLKFNIIYSNKIKHIKDTKIAEFNYKVLHCILPCFDNLKKVENYRI